MRWLLWLATAAGLVVGVVLVLRWRNGQAAAGSVRLYNADGTIAAVAPAGTVIESSSLGATNVDGRGFWGDVYGAALTGPVVRG